eukprot:3455202-Prymnesium_polylepis.1
MGTRSWDMWCGTSWWRVDLVLSSMPPPMPPMPPMPPLLPGGLIRVTTTDELRAAIAAIPPFASRSLYLPQGSVFLLGGAQIIIEGIYLWLVSDGAGATLNAGGSSRVFRLGGDARLQLEGITLREGGGVDDGGTIEMTNSTV